MVMALERCLGTSADGEISSWVLAKTMDTDLKVFSNKVIRLLIKNMGPGNLVVNPDDYMAIRVAFRRIGGSWEKFSSGDIQHINLLKAVVKKWCQTPGRKTDTEVVL